MKLSSLIVVSTLALSAAASSFPFVMWSNKAFTSAEESNAATSFTDVLAEFKSKVDGQDVNQVISVVKESLDTRDLLSHASQFNYLKTQILTNGKIFTNVQ